MSRGKRIYEEHNKVVSLSVGVLDVWASGRCVLELIPVKSRDPVLFVWFYNRRAASKVHSPLTIDSIIFHLVHIERVCVRAWVLLNDIQYIRRFDQSLTTHLWLRTSDGALHRQAPPRHEFSSMRRGCNSLTVDCVPLKSRWIDGRETLERGECAFHTIANKYAHVDKDDSDNCRKRQPPRHTKRAATTIDKRTQTHVGSTWNARQ